MKHKDSSIYAGLSLIAGTTLMYEILLTRIFSVTLWYHLAFLAVSLAMLGLTLGALLVFLLPTFFSNDKLYFHLSCGSFLFSGTMVASLYYHFQMDPKIFHFDKGGPGFLLTLASFSVIAIPFVASGVVITLALTKTPFNIGPLYAADLGGAALGCLSVVGLMNMTEAPNAAVLVAFLASVGGLLFSLEKGSKFPKRMAVLGVCIMGGMALGNTLLSRYHESFLRPQEVKGGPENTYLYEKWNALSRITVHGNPVRAAFPSGWGQSPAYKPTRKIRNLFMTLDASAGTELTQFRGDIADLDHLKYDIVNTAYHLREKPRVLIIGAGGGRDVLSALAFHSPAVTAVEINKDIVRAVNGVFGDFTGHLDRQPNVRFVIDDARSYIARDRNQYDIIQASLIDTWAATAAGAFVLSEHSLYTTEAWSDFLNHLSPKGILTFSRWFSKPRYPIAPEMYRLVALARASLLKIGCSNPLDHIAILADSRNRSEKVGTILVSRSPFTKDEIDRIHKLASDYQFLVALSPSPQPGNPYDFVLVTLTAHSSPPLLPFDLASLNLSPPTDEKPYFFWTHKLSSSIGQDPGELTKIPEFSLFMLALIVITFSSLCALLPILFFDPKTQAPSLLLLLFFAGIGLAFMTIEISLLQRLTLYLGHPTYGLSVLLFSLLLSSGIGSYLTKNIEPIGLRPHAVRWGGMWLAVLTGLGFLIPLACTSTFAWNLPSRILLTIAFIIPLGLLMGIPFPLGMKLADLKNKSHKPWLWGVNGAMSVTGSVMAVLLSITQGISMTFFAGIFCYGMAFLAIGWFLRLQKTIV
ncbi:MAG: hypothetical protein LHV69_01720 [Elusimicrobia bacterium]|nr:hypothetical protein [Candidatus Obscuribacterium magneticum]